MIRYSLLLAYLLAGLTAQASENSSHSNVRIFKFGKSNRLLVRFQSDPASELYQQFLSNYKGQVSGIVDGKDIACLKSSDAGKGKPQQFVCAFIADSKGHITNAFNPNPESNEDTLAQLVLATNHQLDLDIEANTFKQEEIFEIGGGSKTIHKKSDKKIKGRNFAFEGEDAEILYHFLNSGKARKLGSPEPGFANPRKSITLTKPNFLCQVAVKSSLRDKYQAKLREASKKKTDVAKKSADKKSTDKISAGKVVAKTATKPATNAEVVPIQIPSKDLDFSCQFAFDGRGAVHYFIDAPPAEVESPALAKTSAPTPKRLPATEEATEPKAQHHAPVGARPAETADKSKTKGTETAKNSKENKAAIDDDDDDEPSHTAEE